MNRNPNWLDDPDAPPTEEELAAAEALALALETNESDDALYAEALRAAHEPHDLPTERLDFLVERALDAELPRRRGRVIRVAFGGAGAVAALAMAAAAMLFLRTQQADHATSPAAAPTFAAARSSQELFDEPFPRTGGTSERVDRIASARGRDLRANRYAAWGVR
jgi:hypothetical protein